MAQTLIDRNELFFGVNGEPARIDDIVITANQGALLAGTVMVMVPSTRKYVKWDTAAAATSPAVDITPTVGLAILLEDITVTAEASAKAGITGGIDAADVVVAGSTVTALNDYVVAVLKNNGIYVQNMDDSMTTG